VEYTPQVRGWFYVMHVLSTALFDSPAFRHCLVHGPLLAADGKKMSKSLQNFTDPLVLLDRYGSDAFRSYLLSTGAVWAAEHSFKDEGVANMLKKLSLPLWNALAFFTTYAEIDEIDSEELQKPLDSYALTELDRYILSELELLLERVGDKLDGYAIHEAMNTLPDFLDVLNNWYIRRSRQRMWSPDPRSPDKLAFCATVFRGLSRFTQILAPFCPFLAESVWARLGHAESVHLSRWPELERGRFDLGLSREVRTGRAVIAAGLAVRAREKIRVRQPLQKAELVLDQDVPLEKYLQSIKEELNVKIIERVADVNQIAKRVGMANARVLGPRLGREVQKVIALAKQGQFTVNEDGSYTVGEIRLAPEEMEVVYVGREHLSVESSAGVVVALDTQLTPELETEGRARDLVRHIQELRKEANLNVADRIELSVSGAEDVIAAHAAYIQAETLAIKLAAALAQPDLSREIELDGRPVSVSLKLAAGAD